SGFRRWIPTLRASRRSFFKARQSFQVQRVELLRLPDAPQSEAADRREPAPPLRDGRDEARREQDRLVHRSAHRGDSGNLVHRGTDYGEVEPLLAADVAIEHDAEMEPKIHIRRRETLGATARVEGRD